MEDKQLNYIKDILQTHLDSHIKQIEVSREHTNKIIKETIKDVVNGKIDRLSEEQKEIKEHVYRIDSKLNGEMAKYHTELENRLKPFEVDAVENKLVKRIVFGMVSVLLLSVLTALVALVITR